MSSGGLEGIYIELFFLVIAKKQQIISIFIDRRIDKHSVILLLSNNKRRGKY